MKKFFGGIAAAVLLAANVPAMAAELPVKAPIIVPLFIWDGWYVGGNAGYSWGEVRTTSTPNGAVAVAATTQQTRIRGGQGSVEVGYCWQFNPNAPAATVAQNPWLWCIEGRYDFPRERGSIETIPGGVGIIQINNNVDPFLFGPKLGALFANNRLFLYGAGGLAVGKVALSANATTVLNGNEGSGAGSKTKAGWFVGLGGEYLLDRHWSVKIEYDYVNFGGGGVSATLNPTCLRGCTLTPAVVSVGRVHDNVISVGINYHFGTR